MTSDKRILVLGATGYLGSRIVGELSRIYSRVSSGSRKKVTNDDSTVVVDLTSFSQTKNVLSGYDIVVNCVGQISNPIYECFVANTKVLDNIVQSIRNTETKLIHISSVGVYGSVQYANEESELNPETPYSTCKSFAEYLIQERLDEKRYTILRVSNLYGDNQPKGAINYIIQSVMASSPMTFNNNGELSRYFLHVRDCARIVAGFTKGDFSGIYNVVGNEKYTIKELVALAERLSGYRENICYNNFVHPYDNTEVVSDDKTRSILNVEYEHTITSYFLEQFRTLSLI